MEPEADAEFLSDPTDAGPLTWAVGGDLPNLDDLIALPDPPPQVVVVTTTDEELKAVLRRLHPPAGAHRLGSLPIALIPLVVGQLGGRLVVVCKSKQSSSNTKTVVSRLLGSHALKSEIQLVLALGVCHGVCPAKMSDPKAQQGQLIGDVILADKCIDLSLVGEKPDHTEFRAPKSANQRLSTVLSSILVLGWPDQSTKHDWDKVSDRPRPPKATIGAVISGPTLRADGQKLIEVLLHPQVKPYKPLGGEMELYQLVEASEEAGIMWLLVKSISDYGGIKPKNDNGRNLANAAAVDFAVWLLQNPIMDQVLESAPVISVEAAPANAMSVDTIHHRLKFQQKGTRNRHHNSLTTRAANLREVEHDSVGAFGVPFLIAVIAVVIALLCGIGGWYPGPRKLFFEHRVENRHIDVDTVVVQPQLVDQNESDLLREWLQPLAFNAELMRHNRQFLEGTRTWILHDIEAWRRSYKGSRCRALVADAGFGKTSIIARVWKNAGERALALHLFHHIDEPFRSPKRMISSLAFQVAAAFPQFREELEKQARAHRARGDVSPLTLADSVRALAKLLLFDPLSKVTAPLDGGRFLIIIDAVDESELTSKRSLLRFLAHDVEDFPEWIAVLVTGRSELSVLERLSALNPTILDASVNRANNDADVRKYISAFSKCRESWFHTTVADRSEGLFLYLTQIRSWLETAECSETSTGPPRGLAGIFEDRFRTTFPNGITADARTVLEVIVAAPALVHVDDLPDLAGLSTHRTTNVLIGLSHYFPVRAQRVHVFHRAIVEWLTGANYNRRYEGDGDMQRIESDGDMYRIDLAMAHRQLASACSTTLITRLNESASLYESDRHAAATLHRAQLVTTTRLARRDYALRWIVTHLVHSEDLGDAALAVLCSIRFIADRADTFDTLIQDAALVQPAALLHRALVLSKNHVHWSGTMWIFEELWQRLLEPVRMGKHANLSRLVRDARTKASTGLLLSARKTHLNRADAPSRCVLEGHSGAVTHLVRIASDAQVPLLASLSEDGTIRIWDIQACRQESMIEHQLGHAVCGLASFVDNHRRPVLMGLGDSLADVTVWDLRTGGKITEQGEKHRRERCTGSASFLNATGSQHIVLYGRAKIYVWDKFELLSGGRAMHVLDEHAGDVRDVAVFYMDGIPMLASVSTDKSMRIWDLLAGGPALEVLELLSDDAAGITSYLEPNGTERLAVAYESGYIEFWETFSKKASGTLDVFESAPGIPRGYYSLGKRELHGVVAFVNASGAPLLAIWTDDYTVSIWDPLLNSSASLYELRGHSQAVRSVVPLTDENGFSRLASGAMDGTIRIWDVEDGMYGFHAGRVHPNINGMTGYVDCGFLRLVTYAGHRRSAFYRSSYVKVLDPIFNETVDVFELAPSDTIFFRGTLGEPMLASFHRPIISAHPSARITNSHFNEVTFLPSDPNITVWAPNYVHRHVTLAGHSSAVCGLVAFLHSSRSCSEPVLASHTCHVSDAIRVWNPISGKLLRALEIPRFWIVYGLTYFYNADGTPRLVCVYGEGNMQVWDPISGVSVARSWSGMQRDDNRFHDAMQYSTDFPRNLVAAVADSNGGPLLAGVSPRSRTLFVWNMSAVHPRLLANQVEGVISFAHRQQLLVGWSSHTIHVWDFTLSTTTPQELAGHRGEIRGVTAFVDGNSAPRLASWSDDNQVRIWDPTVRGSALFVMMLDSAALHLAVYEAYTIDPCAPETLVVILHEDHQTSIWRMSVQSTRARGQCWTLQDGHECSDRVLWREWSDSPDTTFIFKCVVEGNFRRLKELITVYPDIVHLRSADGRGPLWWAYEYNRTDMIDFMLKRGANEQATDARGLTPKLQL